jgi:hypothetical protein
MTKNPLKWTQTEWGVAIVFFWILSTLFYVIKELN